MYPLERNFSYHEPTEADIIKIIAIRKEAKQLAGLILYNCLDSRERSVALTKIEEAVMWANASLVRKE